MSSSWAQMIKQEIIDIKIRLTAIEAQLKEAGLAPTTKAPEVRKPEAEIIGVTTKELVQATYTIRTTAVAMRGYLQLLGEANLPKDQKKLVRELQYAAMAVMKTAQAIKLLILAQQALALSSPQGYLYLFLAGGVGASSLVYSGKTMGGLI